MNKKLYEQGKQLLKTEQSPTDKAKALKMIKQSGFQQQWENEKMLDAPGKTGSTARPEDFQVTDATIERIRKGT